MSQAIRHNFFKETADQSKTCMIVWTGGAVSHLVQLSRGISKEGWKILRRKAA